MKGENGFENGAHWRLSTVGCVKAMWRYATRRASKQKRRLATGMDLLTGAGLL